MTSALTYANELKKAGAVLGREGMSKAVIEAVADFDGSYKAAMVLAGRLKAVAQAAKADSYWSGFVEDGYHRERDLLVDRTSRAEDMDTLSRGKDRPVAIWHNGDARAYYLATDEERDAWNRYAQCEADRFDADPSLDSYDSTSTAIGLDRDGRITSWCPPIFFPEWLDARRSGNSGHKDAA